MSKELTISQSLIKEVMKPDHCPKQIYYSFVEGKDLLEPSENMLLGRYFESELLGACRGGEKQEPRYLKGGNIAKPFQDCLELVSFAKGVFANIGIDLKNANTETQKQIVANNLSGNIDLRAADFQNKSRLANYDLKWTATKHDDIWNGWGEPSEKNDAIIQATHYTLLSYYETGEWIPFYFLVFGRDKWVKVLQFVITEDQLNRHKDRIANTAATIREYAENDYKGNGDFNKCISCPFNSDCPDRSESVKVEKIYI